MFGEIIFLKNRLIGKYGAEKAVAGWTGPAKTDRDFVYDDLWYEVKTTNPGAPTLKISSIEQLDTDDEGRIVWVEAEKTASVDPVAKSVPRLIYETKSALEGFPEALRIFSNENTGSRFVDRKEYEDIHFAAGILKPFQWFPVSTNQAQDIDTGIISASYDIILPIMPTSCMGRIKNMELDKIQKEFLTLVRVVAESRT